MENQKNEITKAQSQKIQKAEKKKEQTERIIQEVDQKHKGYADYAHSDEALAVYIVRDIVKKVNTKGFWINVLCHSATNNSIEVLNKKDNVTLMYIDCELYPRLTKPVYPPKPMVIECDEKGKPKVWEFNGVQYNNSNCGYYNYDYLKESWQKEADAITWETAHEDIETWKERENNGTICRKYSRWKVIYYEKNNDENDNDKKNTGENSNGKKNNGNNIVIKRIFQK